MKILRVGIVGCGKIADSHVEQIRATGRAEAVAVCDSELLMATQLAERFNVQGVYSNLEAMLDEERLDVIHIATPPASHVSLAQVTFAKGVHAFIEKPFALDTLGAEQIIEAASAAKRVVSVNHMFCFERPYRLFERWLNEGIVGDIVHIDSTYGYDLKGDYGTALMTDPNHWVHRLPGKLFHNVLDHVACKIVPFLDSSAVEVKTQTSRRRPPSGNSKIDQLDDELRFYGSDGKITFSGLISAHARPAGHTMRVYGTRNTIDLDFGARTGVVISSQKQPGSIGRLLPSFQTARSYFGQFRTNLAEFRRADFHYFQGMRLLLTDFYNAIDNPTSKMKLGGSHIVNSSRLIDLLIADFNADKLQQTGGPV